MLRDWHIRRALYICPLFSMWTFIYIFGTRKIYMQKQHNQQPLYFIFVTLCRCRHTAAVHTHSRYLHALHNTQHTPCAFGSSFFLYQLNYQKCICSNFTVFLFENDRIILFSLSSLFSTVSHVNVLILKHFFSTLPSELESVFRHVGEKRIQFWVTFYFKRNIRNEFDLNIFVLLFACCFVHFPFFGVKIVPICFWWCNHYRNVMWHIDMPLNWRGLCRCKKTKDKPLMEKCIEIAWETRKLYWNSLQCKGNAHKYSVYKIVDFASAFIETFHCNS